LSIAGAAVTNYDELNAALAKTKDKKSVALRVLRGGEEYDATLVLKPDQK
jgi:S1-C subfamily serine protease